MLRYLRTAVSVVSVICCLLIIVLWVRSIHTWDRCYWPRQSNGVQLNSDTGHVVLIVGPRAPGSPNYFLVGHQPSTDISGTFYDDDILGFYFERSSGGFRLDVPFWFLSLAIAGVAVAPWIRQLPRRFSLRTLLIGTTIIALALGLIIYAARG
jgi:hypothetical protein